MPKFRKYVDVDSVSSRMVDDFLTEPVKQALGPNVLGQWIIAGLMGFIKPDLVKAVNDDLISFVENGDFKSNAESGTTLSLGTVDKRLGFRKHAFKGTEYCKVTGKIAIVGLRFHNETYDRDLILELKMEDAGGYWRAIQLTNFPEFIGKILEAEYQRQRH